MTEDLQIRLHQEPWSNFINVAILQEWNGKVSVGKNVEMRVKKEGEIIQPTFSINQIAAQKLFNELWHLGFRPKDGTGNSGHVAAIQHHLEDMRKLVFGDHEKDDQTD